MTGKLRRAESLVVVGKDLQLLRYFGSWETLVG